MGMSMPITSLPQSDWVALPQAVALLPSRIEDARAAIACALVEGRLVDRPQSVTSPSDVAALLSLSRCENPVAQVIFGCGEPTEAADVIEFLNWAFLPQSTGRRAWEDWFGSNRINWATGEVRIHTGRTTTIFLPQLRRSDVIALFNIREKKRPGPIPGKLHAQLSNDRKLYRELEEIVRDRNISLRQAARVLEENRKIGGSGSPETKQRRLLKHYKNDRTLCGL